MGKRTMQFG